MDQASPGTNPFVAHGETAEEALDTLKHQLDGWSCVGRRAMVIDPLHKHYGKEGEIFAYRPMEMMYGMTFDGPKQEWIPAEHLNVLDSI